MSTIKAFFDATKAFVSLGATTNATCRQTIRETVGQLADELERALVLADAYLAGVRYAKDDQDLIQYLQGARMKIMTNLTENHVCAGLYQLADRFEQIFDPLRLSLSIGSYHAIPALIQHLKNGERAVLDDLDVIIQQLQDYAARIYTASQADLPALKRELDQSLEGYRTQLSTQRAAIKSLSRQAIDSL